MLRKAESVIFRLIFGKLISRAKHEVTEGGNRKKTSKINKRQKKTKKPLIFIYLMCYLFSVYI